MTTTTTKKPRGGKREGAGRKPDAESARETWITMRCTPEEKDVYNEMGGNGLLRDLIRNEMFRRRQVAPPNTAKPPKPPPCTRP